MIAADTTTASRVLQEERPKCTSAATKGRRYVPAGGRKTLHLHMTDRIDVVTGERLYMEKKNSYKVGQLFTVHRRKHLLKYILRSVSQTRYRP
jgi:hypothetical protein